MGDQGDPPIEPCEELQLNRLHKVNQSMKQLEEARRGDTEADVEVNRRSGQQGEVGQKGT
jgi:hypothetical protein